MLEPIRRVTLMAPADGILRAMSLAVGAMARDGQEIADLDRAEAKARVKIAEASVKEMSAEVKSASGKGDASTTAIAEARLDAAKARSEIAHLELDRCSLRAPFAGRLLSASVSIGQYVSKGSAIADLADVSSLHVLVPVDRTKAAKTKIKRRRSSARRRREDDQRQGRHGLAAARIVFGAPRAGDAVGRRLGLVRQRGGAGSSPASACIRPGCRKRRSPTSRPAPSSTARRAAARWSKF